MPDAVPSFAVTQTDGTARLGRLTHARGELETPALLLYTRRGSPLYLTPDLQAQLGPGARNVVLDATQFVGNPSPETLARAPGAGRGFCALADALLVVGARDATVWNYPQWRKSNDKGARVEAFAGSTALSPAAFLAIAQLFQPDLLVPLSDEVPAEAKDARFKASVARSLRWLDEALKAVKAKGLQTGVLAPIQGGVLPQLRAQHAAEAAQRSDSLAGYALCGLGTGETAAQQRECVAAAVGQLPAEGLRLLQGGLTPGAMLDAVAAGVDCFDAAYATQVTGAGYALDFGASGAGGPAPADAGRGHDAFKLNLLDPALRADAGPLVAGCACFTCRSHTRAYLHHLLLVREMSALVLLELHNLHQLLAWFGAVRAAVRERRFGAFRQAFAAARRAGAVLPQQQAAG